MKKLNHEFKKIIFTIDCDYEELVDAIGLDYSRSGSDLKITQFIESENLKDYYHDNPEYFCANVLNWELAETCSEFKIYNPTDRDYAKYEIGINPR